jgi:S-adenosylmethionine-diacylglycerol 3-amino-3-carboxypropyl transferase
MEDGGMSTEISGKAGFGGIRYAQLWEDAEVLVRALGDRRGDTLVSIGSAGDNALAMLLTDPAEVVAVDLSPAQAACVRLRISAWRTLDHPGVVELMGFAPSDRRSLLLDVALAACDAETARFWDGLRHEVDERGAGAVGKFERYFETFRRRLLPLVHSRGEIAAVFEPRDTADRAMFLDQVWNNWRWRMLLRGFFSKAAMGALGRDPAFFDHVEGSVSGHVARRIEHAFVRNDPVANPYLRWILTGSHGPVLPMAFRPEHFSTIAARIERIRVVVGSLEDLASSGLSAGGWNLSDIFEYMSPDGFEAAYRTILGASRPGARLVYWNMMVPRRVPSALSDRVQTRRDVSEPLAAVDQAFFYSDFVVEDVR